MDAHQFHHHHPVTSFDDVMDLCVVDEDMMKQEPRAGGVSPRDPGGISPLPMAVTTTSTTTVAGDEADGGAYLTFRLAELVIYLNTSSI